MNRLGYIVITLVSAELVAGLYLAVLLAPPRPVLVWNASASAPAGLYRLTDGAIRRGDFVVLHAPDALTGLMATRGYLPRSVPLLKRIAALGGERVCRRAAKITIDGRTVAHALARDSRGRPLPVWQGCHRLGAGEVFVLNAARDSFDSRYFGAVSRAGIVARAIPVWTRKGPGGSLHWRGLAAAPVAAALPGTPRRHLLLSTSSLKSTKG